MPLEEIDELFSRPWLERTNVLYYLRCGCFKELKIRTPRQANTYQLLPVPKDQSTDGNGAAPSEDTELEDEDTNTAVAVNEDVAIIQVSTGQ